MALTIRFTPGRVLAVGDIVTEDVLNDLANPTVELEGTVNTSTIDDGSITLAKLITGILSADSAGRSRMADGFVTAAKLDATQDWTGKTIGGTPTVNWSGATLNPPAGWPVQFARNSSTTYTTLTTQIPLDDTLPQSGEGTLLLSASITPKATTNLLCFRVVVPVVFGNSASAIVALFNSTSADAIAATVVTNSVGLGSVIVLEHVQLAGSTSAQTFNVRIGNNDGATTLAINGSGGTRKLGGVSQAILTVTEITAY